MRRFIAPITAATVAIAVGLLIASVAGAARAAEFESMQARASAQTAAAATEAELAAYKARLQEAYAQLNVTYQVLQSQDAQASPAAPSAGADAATYLSAAAEPWGASSNVVAYAPVTSVAGPVAGPATISAPPPLPTRPVAIAAPAVAPAPAAKAIYCWYDHEGKYVCEDHPQGQ
jgi:hypothetical protein